MALRVGELYGVLKLDKSQFDKGISQGGVSFGKFAKLIAGGAALAVAAIAGIGIASGKMATDFQASMANVHTLLGPGSEMEARVKELGGDVKDMSVETGKSLDDLAGGLYQVISAFGDTADSTDILRISAKASAAGLATTTDAVNLLSAVTKGYGDTSKEAVSKASDLAFLTVKLGQTTFPELAASMGKAVPQANALKVSQEELFGAMATLTGVTGNTAEVSTQLKAVFTALLNSNPKMVAGLKEIGFANGEAAIKALGLQGTLEKLKESTGGNTSELAKMLGSSEALTATLALTGSQAENFTAKTDAMREAVGATDEAFKIQQDTVAATMDRVQAAFGVVLVNIGEKFLPMLQVALEWVVANMPTIQAIFDQVFNAVGAIITWVSENVLPALGAAFQWWVDNILPIFTEGINSVGGPDGIMKMLGDAIDFITTVVVPAFGDVFNWIKDNIIPPVREIFNVMATVILPALGRAFEGVQQWIKDNWPLISKIVGQVAGAVKTAFEIIANIIKTVAPIIVKIGEVVFPIVGEAAKVLLTVLSGVFDAIGVVWQTAADVAKTIVDAITKAWGTLSGFFKGLWDGIGNTIKGAINFVIGLINGFIKMVNDIQIHIPGFDTPFGKVAQFDWNGLNLPYIPKLNVGMPYVPGPMIAQLHEGEAVLRKDQAEDWRRDRFGAGSQGPLIGTQVIQGMMPGDVERETRRAFRRQALQWQLEGR